MYNFGNISKEKMAYISNILEQSKSVNSDNLIPFFLNASKNANEAGITFSDTETEYIINALKVNMTPAQKNKLETIRNMAKMLSNSNSQPNKKR